MSNFMKSTYRAIVAVAFALAATNSYAVVINNGSMTGPPQIGAPPPGWSSVSVDGDTIPVGGLSGWGTGISASPDGGTFLALLNNGGGGAYDAVNQVISGFVVGQAYQLQFDYANIGLSGFTNYANPGFIRANIAGVNLDSLLLSHDGFGQQRWFTFSGSFVASATTHTLTFSAERTGTGGYAGGVDGVSITGASVPVPGSLVLLGLGIAGMTFGRRKSM